MNRQMLSHYGWIIIVTLVITVMIAFATPFGHYVGNGLLYASGGFVDVSKEALSKDNMTNKEQKWEDKIAEMQTGFDFHSNVIPEGGTYIIGAESIPYDSTNKLHGIKDGTGTVLSAGQKFPKLKAGDTYKYGSYLYRYNCYIDGANWRIDNNLNGWSVTQSVLKEEYESPLGGISGKNVVFARHLFCNNPYIKTSPPLPDTIESMVYTFKLCTKLSTVTNIPTSTDSLHGTFTGCKALKTIPKLPNGIKNMQEAFQDCTKLTGTITINSSPTSYDYCFENVDFTAQNLTLAGSSTRLSDLGATGNNYQN